MKKILTSMIVWIALVIPAYAGSFGVTLSSSTIDTALTDDIDSNGTIDTRKNVSNDVFIGSVFLENSAEFGSGLAMTVGLDWIPFDAEFDSRSTTQSSVKAKGDGAASTGTNKGTVDVTNHLTFYVQPGKVLDNGMTVYLTAGYVRADVDKIVDSISSTNKTVSETVDGTKLGVGLKKDLGDLFVKLDYAETDYDVISVTTSNNTKVTGDIDNKALSFSVGNHFNKR